jgi:hypothetical protein
MFSFWLALGFVSDEYWDINSLMFSSRPWSSPAVVIDVCGDPRKELEPSAATDCWATRPGIPVGVAELARPLNNRAFNSAALELSCCGRWDGVVGVG